MLVQAAVNISAQHSCSHCAQSNTSAPQDFIGTIWEQSSCHSSNSWSSQPLCSCWMRPSAGSLKPPGSLSTDAERGGDVRVRPEGAGPRCWSLISFMEAHQSNISHPCIFLFALQYKFEFFFPLSFRATVPLISKIKAKVK